MFNSVVYGFNKKVILAYSEHPWFGKWFGCLREEDQYLASEDQQFREGSFADSEVDIQDRQ